jgi:hypothetical protein
LKALFPVHSDFEQLRDEYIEALRPVVDETLGAPSDIDGGTPVHDESPARENADPALRAVLETYREGYAYLRDHCMRWWRGCLASAQQPGRATKRSTKRMRSAQRIQPLRPRSSGSSATSGCASTV